MCRSGNLDARRAAGSVAFIATLFTTVYPATVAPFEYGELGVSFVLFLDAFFVHAPY
jgi:hypothetical protein